MSVVSDLLRTDPVLEEYMGRVTRAAAHGELKMPALRTPLDVLADQKARAWALIALPADKMDVTVGMQSPEARESLAHRIAIAPPYLWRHTVISPLLDITLPEHVISRDVLPAPRMWWALEQDEYLASDDATLVLHGIYLEDQHDGFRVYLMGSADDGKLVCWVDTISYGMRYPTERDDVVTRQVLVMLSFLNSPYIPTHTQLPARQERRRLGAVAERAVTFVDLRTAIDERRHAAGEAGTRIRRNRWLVRGHLRAQWYPSQSAHHVIWVAPYVKGPAGAQLKSTVYRVAR